MKILKWILLFVTACVLLKLAMVVVGVVFHIVWAITLTIISIAGYLILVFVIMVLLDLALKKTGITR